MTDFYDLEPEDRERLKTLKAKYAPGAVIGHPDTMSEEDMKRVAEYIYDILFLLRLLPEPYDEEDIPYQRPSEGDKLLKKIYEPVVVEWMNQHAAALKKRLKREVEWKVRKS